MKNLIKLSILITGLLNANDLLAKPFKKEQSFRPTKNQDRRINNGLKNGQLNKREYARIQKKDHRIDVYKKKALSDGELSSQEKFKLRKMNHSLNKSIWKQKHDGQTAFKGPENRPEKGSKEFFEARKKMKENRENKSPLEDANMSEDGVETAWDVSEEIE